MTATTFLVIVFILWLLIGATLGLLMGRRGHSAIAWALIGASLGPLAAAFAVGAVMQERRSSASPETPAVPSLPATGLDVLVGYDGSANSMAAARTIVELLGPRLGRVTLAWVLDYETPIGSPDGRRASAAVSTAAEEVASAFQVNTAAVVLNGHPARALLKHALSNGHGLLAVGSRGHGASEALLGSVAGAASRMTGIPVLIVGAEPANADPSNSGAAEAVRR